MSTFIHALLLVAGIASATEKEAENALRTKIWDGYAQGWSVRTATSVSLGSGEHRVYLVTLYAGNDYRVLATGDANAANIDIVLYDAEGKQVSTDASNDREPKVDFRPGQTGTYYVAVHASKLLDANQKAGVATAVTYK